jgi:hypothetical protein
MKKNENKRNIFLHEWKNSNIFAENMTFCLEKLNNCVKLMI